MGIDEYIMLGKLQSLPTFIMPYYGWRSADRAYLEQAVESLHCQTDPDWQLVIIEDGSPLSENRVHLRNLVTSYEDRVCVIFQKINRGAASSRNIGIDHAHQAGAPFVLFQDSDDLSHPERLRMVRELFTSDPHISVVYSTFDVIDENSQPVALKRLTPSIRELLESHEAAPAGHGEDVLIQLGTQTGYATLTSTLAARTDLARRTPFPAENVSEDAHTWFRYAARADRFHFAPEIPSLYRVPQNGTGSSVRERVGSNYYAEKARVDAEGFIEALEIAIERGRLHAKQRPALLSAFYTRIAITMRREGEVALADELVQLSYEAANIVKS